MPTLESLTVDQLAALCGLERDGCGTWTDPVGTVYQRRMVAPKAFSTLWNVWPEGTHGQRIEAPNEHAALVALARHLNVKPPEIPVKYKRIDRDPKTDDYVDYTPKAGDRWHFGRGEPWTVKGGDRTGPRDGINFNTSPELRSLTTYIERPVKVRDVRGPDYAPQAGDVLCGPDGPLFVVAYVVPGAGMPCVTPIGRTVPEVKLAIAHFALCTRIEREE